MTAQDIPRYMVGPRRSRYTDEQVAAGPPESRTIECEMCKEPTLFAGSTLKRSDAAGAKFICIPCAKALGPVEIGEPSAQQRREIEAMGFNEEQAQQWLAAAMGAADDDGSGRPTDTQLQALRTIYQLAIEIGQGEKAAGLPALAMVGLIDELLERRAHSSGIVAAFLRDAPKLPNVRANDTTLAGIAKEWCSVASEDPGAEVAVSALALTLLVDELIELRKAPRA